MQLTDHLFLLTGAGYGQVGNAYAVLSEERLTLIDAGKDDASLEIMLDNLVLHHLDRYPVTDVLLTHMHNDHSGNAWYWQEKGAKIRMSESDASGLASGGIRVNDYGLFPFHTCMADDYLEDDVPVTLNGVTFRPLLMPGHTNGSMFFLFEIDGFACCATGDTVIPVPGEFDRGFEASFGWKGSSEMDNEKLFQTLERALQIRCDILLGGHGIPVMRAGDEVLKLALRTAYMTLR